MLFLCFHFIRVFPFHHKQTRVFTFHHKQTRVFTFHHKQTRVFTFHHKQTRVFTFHHKQTRVFTFHHKQTRVFTFHHKQTHTCVYIYTIQQLRYPREALHSILDIPLAIWTIQHITVTFAFKNYCPHHLHGCLIHITIVIFRHGSGLEPRSL